jgi:Sulfotransferase family
MLAEPAQSLRNPIQSGTDFMDSQLRLPKFFIIGVAKSGTTDLASLLQCHPAVFVPKIKEPIFFSRDELHLHTEAFLDDRTPWKAHDWDTHFDALIREYCQYFEEAPAGALLGEATTEYFPSRRAAGRIRGLIPDAKLIVMFREPVKRMISDYWFHVQYDRRVLLKPEPYFGSNSVGARLRWGLYQEHLTHWLSVFPRDQFHFILFEEYISPKTRQDVLDGVCEFLEIEPTLDADQEVFSNKTGYPRSLTLELALNLIRIRYGLPGSATQWEFRRPCGRRRTLINHIVQKISSYNIRYDRRAPAWPAHLVERLHAYYRHENAQLSELIGRDVDAIWYGRKEEEKVAVLDRPLNAVR